MGMTQNSTPVARFQVVETQYGFQVKDMKTGMAWGKHYVRPAWAIKLAVKLCGIYRSDKTYANVTAF